MFDCEIHPLIADLDPLLEHVPAAWRPRLSGGEFRLPPAGPHPGVELEPRAIAGGTDPVQVAAELPATTSHAILIPAQVMQTPGWLSYEMAAVYVSAVNDHLLETWLGADPRFRLALALAPNDPELAVAELRRVGSREGIVAVCMPAGGSGMGAKAHHPVYELAAELSLPLIVHPSGTEGAVQGAATLGGTGPFTAEQVMTLLPQVAAANLAGLIYDGVFERFPRLTVVFAGFGYDWAVPFLWRADQEWRNLRSEVPWLSKPPSEYVGDHVRFVVDGAAGTAHPGLWKAADMLPEQALMFGSDTPFAGSRVEDALSLAPRGSAERIGAGNALDTFAARL